MNVHMYNKNEFSQTGNAAASAVRHAGSILTHQGFHFQKAVLPYYCEYFLITEVLQPPHPYLEIPLSSLTGQQQAEGGSTRWGRAVCGLRSPLKRYLSDVEVKLHNMHMHDQVFITNNDEHVEEI